MKINTSHLVGAAIVLAAVFFSKLDAQDAPEKAEYQKWEYKYKACPAVNFDETDLWSSGAYGLGGWEVVSVYYDSKKSLHYAVFKRPVQ